VTTTLTTGEFVGVRRSIILHSLAVISPVAAAISVYNAVWEVGSLPHLEQAELNLLEAFGITIFITVGANLVLKSWLAPQARWAVDGARRPTTIGVRWSPFRCGPPPGC
jgi:hypothetical protein